MTKQRGFFQLHGGSIGDITYFKTKNGYYARARNKKKEMVAEENGLPKIIPAQQQVFGKAAAARKLIRSAFAEHLPFVNCIIRNINNLSAQGIRR